MTEFWTE